MTLGVSDAHAEQFSLGVLSALAGMLTDNLADSFFPDDGPFARKFYQKHMEAIAGTAMHDVFSIFGGNRCITPWTQIETGRAMRQAHELTGAGVIDVRSWDGSSRCTKQAEAPYLKAIAPAFRVVLDNGSVFEATRKHRVLTVEGWTSLDRLIQRASGLRCTRTPQGSTASCDTARNRCGLSILADQAAGQGEAPSQGDVRELGLRGRPAGAAERRSAHSRAYPEFVLPSTIHDPDRIAALCAHFEAPKPICDAAQYSQIHRVLRRLQRECAPHSEAIEAVRDLLTGIGSVLRPVWTASGSLPSIGELFFAWEHPLLFGGNRIVSVENIGYQPILDITVDSTSCYESGGVVHHNSGKTTLLAYIVSRWLTGIYPPWWTGKVFPKPTTGWAVSQTSSTIVRALQLYLIGSTGEGGLIPRANILNVQYSPNAMGMAHRVQVRHEPTGLTSELYFKTYDMGWKRFQSDTIDFAVLDEEPPAKIYSESMTRSMSTNGLTLLGFTALDGVTPLVAHLLPEFAGADAETAPEDEEPASRGHVFIGWDDVPYAHLPKAKRESMAKGYLPHERDARMKGIPSIGTGLIYPVGHEQFVVDADTAMKAWRGPTPPKHWPRIAAADPGGTPKGDGRTAALWAAYDEDSDCLWIYAEYYARFSPITSHVHAWAKKGNWIPFCIDPAGANITDGKAVYAEYVSEMRELNKDWPVHKADKRWSLGRAELYDRMTSERCKVLSTCTNFLAEHRGYARNENNQIIGVCHLLDCARYLVRGARHAALPPQYQRHDVIPEQRFF